MNLRDYLESKLEELNGMDDYTNKDYTSPDGVLSIGATAFICTRMGNVYYETYEGYSFNDTKGIHWTLAKNTPELQKRYKWNPQKDDFDHPPRWTAIESGDLIGRISAESEGKRIITFWNKSHKTYDRLLKTFLKDAIQNGYISPSDEFSAPTYPICTIADMLKDTDESRATSLEDEADELLRKAGFDDLTDNEPVEKVSDAQHSHKSMKLHNLPGPEKKAELDKRGYKQRPRREPLGSPDFWRLYSEGK